MTPGKLPATGHWAAETSAFYRNILLRTTLDTKREIIDGKRLLEYSYDMPVEKERLTRSDIQWVEPTAYIGTLLLDPDAGRSAR